MVSEKQSAMGYNLMLTAVGVFIVVVIFKHQWSGLTPDPTGAGIQLTDFSPDFAVLCTLMPLFVLMVLRQAWAGWLGPAACLVMLAGAAGWLWQFVERTGTDADTATPTLKAVAALGCLAAASIGLLLRVANVRINIGFATDNEMHIAYEPQPHPDRQASDEDNGATALNTTEVPIESPTAVKTYNALNEMPSDMRATVEELIGKHKPDAASHGLFRFSGSRTVISDNKYVVKDTTTGREKVYKNVADLPPEMRQIIENLQRHA